MQDLNDLPEVLKAKIGTFDDLAKEPLSENATHRVIGKLPQEGEIVKLHGLMFTVRFVNNKTGEMRLTLTRDAELPLERKSGTCPSCSGVGHYLVGNFDETCSECEGTGHV